ncbi:hypothetical protein LG200_07865 [Methylobacillus caricis]|uniref:protein YgfX n=1 Tax=Methylobacillus caricis TaxID=1971611 RepID=UPI001CFF613C|nr:protein YgfX [Methylobacillus caricis]MCB5187921.1 hypothetical protein [Methylobacillus caricis]
MQKRVQYYSVKPLTLILRPSRILAFGFAIAGVVTGITALLIPMMWWLKGILLLAVAWQVMRHARHQALRAHPESCIRLELDSKGDLYVLKRSGKREKAQVLGSSFVSSYLTMLNLKLGRGRTHCVIVPDAVDPTEFRRLRVWLRWGVHGRVEGHEL